ncbi:MAG: hypothetical protein U0R19_11560 [Bryobacteraceae bacterium]
MRAALGIYFGWFLIPLLLASLARPFALWDYFTSTGLFHKGRPIEWGTLLSNTVHHLATGQYVIRPTAVFLYDLQTLLFGGEFWLWYLLKWAAFAASVCLVWDLLKRLGCDWVVRAAMAAVLLFHPARFTLMLHAPDGWMALGMVAQLWLLALFHFDAVRMGRWAQVGWFALALFTIGTKEVAWVFQALLALFAITKNRKCWKRVLPHVALIAAWLWILSRGAERAAGFTISAWWPRFVEQIGLVIPTSPAWLLGIVFCALLLAAILRRDSLALFCLLTAAAMIAFVVIPPLVALRYAIAPSYLLAIAMGLGLQSLPRGRIHTALFLIIAVPLFTAGSIYRQELAYQHQFFEVSTALAEMDTKARGGYGLAITGLAGDFEGEAFHTIQRFFFQYGPKWYGLDAPRAMVVVKDKGWPQQPFTMLSLFDPQRMERDAKLDMRRVESAYAMVPGDHGAFGRLANRYYQLDRLLGRTDVYRYDSGGPEIRTAPHFYLYIVGDANTAGRRLYTLHQMPAGRRPGGF